jgi:hypothetical protein
MNPQAATVLTHEGSSGAVCIIQREYRNEEEQKLKIEVAGLAHDELKIVMKIMSRAEKADDLKALKWSARKIAWLYKVAELIDTEPSGITVDLFNDAWQGFREIDPPPTLL